MGNVKRHGNGSYGNSRRISMRKEYTGVMGKVPRRIIKFNPRIRKI